MGRCYRRLFTISIIISALLSFFSTVTLAQNNPYKIHDKLYPIYQRAYNSRDTQKGLLIADTLFNEAKKLNDKKAQCLALTISLLHYYSKQSENISFMQNAVTRLKDFSRASGYEQYYYYACNNYINYLIMKGEQARAYEYAYATHQEAKKRKSKIGIYNGMKALGNIHYLREEHFYARKYYNDAIEYAKANLKDEYLSPLYYRLASSCYYSGLYDNAIKYSIIARNSAKTEITRYRAELIECISYFGLKQYDKFLEIYNRIESAVRKIDTNSNSFIHYADIMYNIYHKNFNKANEIADRNPYATRRHALHILINEHKGDYRSALNQSIMLVNLSDSVNTVLARNNLINLEAQLSKYILDEEKRDIELENTNLALTNSNLELQLARNAARSEQINSQNSLIAYKNKELEARNLQAEYDRMQLLRNKKDEEDRNAKIILHWALGSSILIIITIVVIIVSRSKLQRKLELRNSILSRNHEKLTIARQNAEQADMMKTQFLQNMSHEIRTPLNAIVGFSQLIAENGDALDEDEKADFAKRIESNSEVVLDIVNGILDITSIESGNYKMQHFNTRINELCRKAIASYKDKVPNGVNLMFGSDVEDSFSISTDEKRVMQVIGNLLSNSVKNTTAGHISVNVSYPKNDDKLSIAVADTGIGISKDITGKIFDRFFKADTFKQGIGLGLSISQTIAEYLNGRIYLDTAYHSGARFVLELPAA